jgi:hypothetical protein
VEKYCTDKPDIRFGMECCTVTDIAKNSEFKVFLDVIKKKGIVKVLNAEECGEKLSRNQIDELIEFAKQNGALGLAWMRVTHNGLESNIAKFFPAEIQKKLIEKIGIEEPRPKDPRGTIESILADADYMTKDHEFTKLFTKTKEFQDVYEAKLASSLIASKMIGNLYTASLYLGFRSSLEFEFQKGVELEGKRIGFGSYGSGSSAMVFSGVIQPSYKQVVKDMNLEAELGKRKKLSLEEYEEIHENRRGVDKSILEPKKEFVLVSVETAPESSGERKYAFNE